MKDPHDIIKRPILTEKAYEGIEEKRYVFEVDIRANKAEIKEAVEAVFKDDGVKVAKVPMLYPARLYVKHHKATAVALVTW